MSSQGYFETSKNTRRSSDYCNLSSPRRVARVLDSNRRLKNQHQTLIVALWGELRILSIQTRVVIPRYWCAGVATGAFLLITLNSHIIRLSRRSVWLADHYGRFNIWQVIAVFRPHKDTLITTPKRRGRWRRFCEIPQERVIAENELAYAILDAFPVTDQHTLVVPKRHLDDFFSLYQPERNAIQQLLEERRQAILESDSNVTGFNVGNNIGEDGGQTIMHCHTHLIARRKGDMSDARGGVRGVIPGKQKY